jgi:hypothetical protein
MVSKPGVPNQFTYDINYVPPKQELFPLACPIVDGYFSNKPIGAVFELVKIGQHLFTVAPWRSILEL